MRDTRSLLLDSTVQVQVLPMLDKIIPRYNWATGTILLRSTTLPVILVLSKIYKTKTYVQSTVIQREEEGALECATTSQNLEDGCPASFILTFPLSPPVPCVLAVPRSRDIEARRTHALLLHCPFHAT